MLKLKVTWQDGAWDTGPGRQTSTEITAAAKPRMVGDMVVWDQGDGSPVLLVIPESRLISATRIEVAE